MPRRVPTPGSDDSLKENSQMGRFVKVKAEKVKTEKEKDDNEDASKTKGKGKQRVENDIDEEDQGEEQDELHSDDNENEGDDEGDEGSPKGRKRARVNVDGDASPPKREPTRRRITLPRDSDGFIPGSIVRIQLSNFVTYDFVEFRPGPYLNMILGPNGTGKSSIACAICLGLNFSTSILGRASDLNSFVKIGTSTAYIEIELKGPRNKPNLIIRRNLKSANKGSSFTLNGTHATGREVTERVAALNVQVGNLCSFLPQDKVSEFAAMTAAELLKETQRAAGDEKLTEWHETLIESGKTLRQVQETLTVEQDQLRTLEQRNAALENQVFRYKERMKIQHQIDLLELLLPVQRYREAREEYSNLRTIQRALTDKVKALKEKNAPVHTLKEKLDKDYKAFEKSREDKKKQAQGKFREMSNKWKASDKLGEKADELHETMDTLMKEDKDRRARIQVLKESITKLDAQLAIPVEHESSEKIQADMRALAPKKADYENRFQDLRHRREANAEQAGIQQAEIETAMRERQKLEDVNVQKLNKLRGWNKDHADAVEWLRGNHHRFRMEVFDPPVISVAVPDGRYANAVESCFSAGQLLSFVAQCQEDSDTLNRCINDTTEGLGRRARINVWFRPKQEGSLIPPPMSHEELKSTGFDAYAIDLVKCPDGLLWFLQREVNLHRTAIGINGKSVNTNLAMDLVSRFGPNGTGGGANFIAGSVFNQVSRSKYGKRMPFNATRDVRQARNLVGTTVDSEAKRVLEQRAAAARHLLAEFENTEKKFSDEAETLKEEKDEIEKASAAIRKRSDAVKDILKKHVAMVSKQKTLNDELQKKMDAPPVDVKKAQTKKEILDTAKKRVKIAKEHAALVRAAIRDQIEATRVGIEYLQVGANKTALEELCQQKDAKYTKAVAEWQDADKAFQASKLHSKQILDASRQKITEVSDELRAAYDEIEGRRLEYGNELKEAQENNSTPPPAENVELRNTEQLEADLETRRAELDMNLITNPGVVDQYERRKTEIENLTAVIAKREKDVHKVEQKIKTARDNWEPALNKLVASINGRFSAAFDRIGCAGELEIYKDDKYEDWELRIKVKFRDHEKLQQLTRHRQSGGERSLSTILYLMSLTVEARAPFSLVDEINQGMDARAERAVHNSMVEVTCEPDSAQYFLITPKLLPDLLYHERMKILCVNNGEWLPEDDKDLEGSMMNMLQRVMQMRAAN